MRLKPAILAPALAVLAVMVVFAGLLTGPFHVPLNELWTALTDPEHPQHIIIADLRLRRVLEAFFTGAALTGGGFLMQAIARNPLADPYLMGVSAGAGFGVNLKLLGILTLGGTSVLALPVYAFAGAFLSLALLLLLGGKYFRSDGGQLLVAGVAVSSFFVALTGVLIYLFAANDTLHQVIFWNFGDFENSDWTEVSIVAGMSALLLAFGWLAGARLDLLQLGEMHARSSGVSTGGLRIITLLVCSAGIGGVVAFVGPVGFVGMMVPHFSRALNGSTHRRNMLPGILLGGIYLAFCDILSRWIYPPAGLPIGIVTALFGVPFFLYLLFAKAKRGMV